jgi:DNA mismatch repair protein MutL
MTHEGRRRIRAPRVDDWLDRAADLLGAFALRLTPTMAEQGALSLRALVSPVGLHRRSSTGAHYHYVNGRFVRDRLVRRAVIEAYRAVTPKGRYPVVVLDLQVPPDAVDVNVHPHKTEVRFRNPREVEAFIVRALRTAIGIATAQDKSTSATAQARQIDLLPSAPTPSTASAPAPMPSSAMVETYEERERALPMPLDAVPTQSLAPTQPDRPGMEAVEAPATPAPVLRFIGILHGNYWLCEADTGLALVDPFAARERVLRAALERAFTQGPLQRRPLLLPDIVALSAEQYQAVLYSQQALDALGCEVEGFDELNVAIKSVPDALETFDAAALLRDLAGVCVGPLTEGVLLTTIARHGAAAEDVSRPLDEVQAALEALSQVGPGSPEDRPIAVAHFSLEQLEASFESK